VLHYVDAAFPLTFYTIPVYKYGNMTSIYVLYSIFIAHKTVECLGIHEPAFTQNTLAV